MNLRQLLAGSETAPAGELVEPGAGTDYVERPDQLGPLPALDVPAAEAAGRIVLGDARLGRKVLPVATGPAAHVAVLGATRTGKTTTLFAGPLLGDHPGKLLVSSVKADLAALSLAYRHSRGPVSAFDPTGQLAHLGLGSAWSPVTAASDWDSAFEAGDQLVRASDVAAAGGGSNAFFIEQSAVLLPAILLAANRAEQGMGRVLAWISSGTEGLETVRELVAGDELAVWAVDEALNADAKTRANVVSTLSSTLRAYRSSRVLELSNPAPDRLPFDHRRFLTEPGPATHFVVAAPQSQSRLAPVLTAHLASFLEVAYKVADEHGGQLPFPVLLMLDEAANTARLSDLTSVLTTCASLGITVVTAWHDLTQMKQRYGDGAITILNNSLARVVLPSSVCPATLDWARQVGGDVLIRRESHKAGIAAITSVDTRTSASDQLTPLLPAHAVRQTPEGDGVLIYGQLRPVRLRLRPFYRDARLLARSTLGTGG